MNTLRNAPQLVRWLGEIEKVLEVTGDERPADQMRYERLNKARSYAVVMQQLLLDLSCAPIEVAPTVPQEAA